MDYTQLLKIRYLKPIESLRDSFPEKTIISASIVVFAQIGDFFSSLGDIFNTPVELIILLIISMVIDLITGIMASRRKGVLITSVGLRQFWIKIIEYSAGLLIISGIANVFGDNTLGGWVGDSLHFLNNIHWIGYLYVILTELKSVNENISGNNVDFSKVISKMWNKFFKDDN